MTTPTDVEIREVWEQYNPLHGIESFARAVLAKWGTPAPVGVEPVAWRVRRLDSPNYWIIFLHKPVDALMDLKREVQPLYTTPQPTQAQAGAVPLTDREIELIDGMIQVQLDHASRCDAIAIKPAFHALPWNPHGYWAYVFAYSAGEAPFSPIWSKNSHTD